MSGPEIEKKERTVGANDSCSLLLEWRPTLDDKLAAKKENLQIDKYYFCEQTSNRARELHDVLVKEGFPNCSTVVDIICADSLVEWVFETDMSQKYKEELPGKIKERRRTLIEKGILSDEDANNYMNWVGQRLQAWAPLYKETIKRHKNELDLLRQGFAHDP
jgi:hypothetical protein